MADPSDDTPGYNPYQGPNSFARDTPGAPANSFASDTPGAPGDRSPINPMQNTPGRNKYQGPGGPARDTPGPPADRGPSQAPEESESSWIGDTFNSGISTAKKFGSELISAAGFAKQSRSQNLPGVGGPSTTTGATAKFSTAGTEADWRIKLSIPQQFATDTMLSPLISAGGNFVFPYTPTIIVGHSANYNTLQPVHTNYPFHIYENSSVQEIVITGDFTVENAEEGQYWIAAMHYLRSVTKMFYGDGDNAGAPPPLVKLNGYGDYVFSDVPCVVTNFTIDLPSDVDYVAVPLPGGPTSGAGYDTLGAPSSAGRRGGNPTAWVPTQSLMTVTVQPTYSRKTLSQFNLNDFVNGDFVKNGSGFI